jgi:aminopeptidase-like protein
MFGTDRQPVIVRTDRGRPSPVGIVLPGHALRVGPVAVGVLQPSAVGLPESELIRQLVDRAQDRSHARSPQSGRIQVTPSDTIEASAIAAALDILDTPPAAGQLFSLVEELYPICRSITGDGVRQTLEILSRVAPIEVHEVPSGTPVLDWVVPPEWNIREAWIADSTGTRVVDFARSSLHVVSYSVPIRARMSLAELRPNLFTLPPQPELVPYRTSYYEPTWGFCLSQRVLDTLTPGDYEVCIDSTLEPGSLTYGELVVPGTSNEEFLISAHVCHPSLGDDNLSGLAVSIHLAAALLAGPTPRHTFRFLYAPGTIGAITWLARHREDVDRIAHGLTLTCLGDDHPFTYKRTVGGDAVIDRAATQVLRSRGSDDQVIDFFPYGYDERQYNSPGFRLPVGSLMRGRHGEFPEYHTSADNLSFVSGARMVESFDVLRGIIAVVERERAYVNTSPYGEPQLGSRGLYRALGGMTIPDLQLAMLWVLNLSDGDHGLLDIAARSGMSFESIAAAADLLREHELLDDHASTEKRRSKT